MRWGAWALALSLLACGGAKARGEPMVADAQEPEEPALDVDAGDDDGGAPPDGAALLQGDEEGARALLAQFTAPDADHVSLTRSLRPTANDYKSLFDEQAAAVVEEAQAKDWDSNKAAIRPKPGQTEIKVWGATGAELASGAGDAKEFPGGYKKVAKHLSPTATFFRFKFVEPGKETGTAYDGLAFVNGHWVIAPKPWRAMEGKAGALDDEGASTTEAKPKKKPRKPKKKPRRRGKKR